MATEFRPFVGPLPFETEDREIFFGRNREISDLLSLIIAHDLTLVYSRSGAGKTSLINAGLIPQLEAEGFEIFPLARVRGLVAETSQPEQIRNIYIFNTLTSFAGEETDPRSFAETSLGDYLEERRRAKGDAPSPRALIFDQFEELFTIYPSRWRERRGFFEQLSQALESDPLLRVVLVMREDFIAQLDPYTDLFREKLRTRFRLERLRRQAALTATTGPLSRTTRSFAPGVAEELIEDLQRIRVETESGESMEVTGEFVEPVQLQVVCQSLWEDLPPEVTEITSEHLRTFGDPIQALAGFYERSLATAIHKTGVREGELRRWFETVLITSAGTRDTVYCGRETTGGLANSAVEALENAHLIRGERRAGGRWYELNHDRFIDPVLKSNKRWWADRGQAEETHQRLEAGAAAWEKWGQGRLGLLDEPELLEAEQWLDSPEAEEMAVSEPVSAWVRASRDILKKDHDARQELESRKELDWFREQQDRAKEHGRTLRRHRRLMIGLLITSLLATVSTIIAYKEHLLARQIQFDQAIALKSEQGQLGQVITLRSEAEGHFKLGEYREALDGYRKMKELAESSDDLLMQGEALVGEAEVLSRLDKNEEAMQSYRTARALFEATGSESARAKALYDEAPRQTDALLLEARIYDHLNDFRIATARAEEVIRRYEQWRRSYSTPSGRIVVDEISLIAYDCLIPLLAHRVDSSSKALSLAERASSRVLLDLLTTRQLTPEASPRFESPAKESNIERERARVERELQQIVALGRRQRLLERLRQLDQDRTWKKDRIISPVVPAEPLDAFAIRRLANEVGPMLFYYAAEDQVLAFLVPQEEDDLVLKLIDLPRKELNQMVLNLLNYWANPMLERQAQQPAHELWNLLLAPFLDHLPSEGSLAIISDSPLRELPFEALTDPAGKPLYERWDISILPSASILAMARQRHEPRDNDTLSILWSGPGIELNQGEAIDLADFFSGSEVIEASLCNYQQAVLARRHLLITTRGACRGGSYTRTYLEVNPDDGHHEERLTFYEISLIPINVELVTLTACDAATLPFSDQHLDITSAFLIAGAASVLSTRWRVPDYEGTTHFLVDFYRAYRKGGPGGRGMRKDEALTEARRLSRMRGAPAQIWAAWVLIGDPR